MAGSNDTKCEGLLLGAKVPPLVWGPAFQESASILRLQWDIRPYLYPQKGWSLSWPLPGLPGWALHRAHLCPVGICGRLRAQHPGILGARGPNARQIPSPLEWERIRLTWGSIFRKWVPLRDPHRPERGKAHKPIGYDPWTSEGHCRWGTRCY